MIISVAQAQLFLLALTRILAIIIHMPMLGGPMIPNQVKVGVGLLLTIILLPWKPLPADAQSMSLFVLAVAIGREIIIGTLVGYAALLTFGALEIAGELMGVSSGFAAGRILNPALENSGSAFSQLFTLSGTLMFMIINGHHIFLVSLQRSFVIVPLNTTLPQLSLDRLMLQTTQVILVGVQLALPVMGALLLTDLTLGLLARVAPQVQVFFLGLPLKIGLGLLTLAFSLGILFPVLSQMFHTLGQRSLNLLGG